MVHRYIEDAVRVQALADAFVVTKEGERSSLCLVASVEELRDAERYLVRYITPEGDMRERVLRPTNYVFYPEDPEDLR
ncbi:MAG: hypothetical protein AAGK74_00210 [Chloroflexota bacterium]